MAEPDLDVEIRADELRALLQQMRRLENAKPLKKELGQAMRAAGKPMLKSVRAGVLATPSTRSVRKKKGHVQGELRRNIAKAAKIQVRTGGRGAGVVIRIDPRKMPAGKNNLPGYLDGRPPFDRWRHPVFGNSDVFVTQRSHPFFLQAIQPHMGEATRQIDEALNKIRRELES